MFDVLEKAHFDWDKDELYVLGDMIDRGPESAEALIWAVDEAPSNVHFLLGNHEDMAYPLLKDIQDQHSVTAFIYNRPWDWNGGNRTLGELKEQMGCDWCHKAAAWIDQLPLYYTLQVNGMNILLVHAGLETNGVRPYDDFIEEGKQDYIDIPEIGEVWTQHLIWTRERWFHNKTAYPYDYIIFGHSPTTFKWWETINWFNEKHPIAVQGQPGYMVRLSGYGNGHMRYCIDTGRDRLGLLRLDDMQEFYSTFELEDDYE